MAQRLPRTEYYTTVTAVTVAAIPTSGWAFDRWFISGEQVLVNPATVLVDEYRSATASFKKIELRVDKEGLGTVSLSPPGITDTPTFTQPYDTVSPVTVTANPEAGWGFKEWAGDKTGTATPTSLLVDTHKQVTAVFAQVELTVDKEGEGTVAITPPGGAQTLPYIETYGIYSSIGLGATPACGWIFDHWDGNTPEGKDEDNPLVLPMDEDKVLSAVFVADRPYIVVFGGAFANPPEEEDVRPFENGMFDWADINLDEEYYDVHMHSENDADEDGNGPAFDGLLAAINNSERPLRVVVAGHSHGGGSVADLCQRLAEAVADEETDVAPFDIILTIYIDAIAQDPVGPNVWPETRFPAGSSYHVNLYQQLDDLIPTDGGPVAGAQPNWDVNGPALPCVNGIGHTAMDSCEVVHNIMANRLEHRAYCGELDHDYCDDGDTCGAE